jgi:hypothetical protein
MHAFQFVSLKLYLNSPPLVIKVDNLALLLFHLHGLDSFTRVFWRAASVGCDYDAALPLLLCISKASSATIITHVYLWIYIPSLSAITVLLCRFRSGFSQYIIAYLYMHITALSTITVLLSLFHTTMENYRPSFPQ